MSKFYQVVKEHPFWEVGAIISNEVDGTARYYPIEDLWVKEAASGKGWESFYEDAALVEHQPEWFKRIYKSGPKKDKFVSKEEALKAYAVTDVETK